MSSLGVSYCSRPAVRLPMSSRSRCGGPREACRPSRAGSPGAPRRSQIDAPGEPPHRSRVGSGSHSPYIQSPVPANPETRGVIARLHLPWSAGAVLPGLIRSPRVISENSRPIEPVLTPSPAFGTGGGLLNRHCRCCGHHGSSRNHGLPYSDRYGRESPLPSEAGSSSPQLGLPSHSRPSD